LGFSLVNLISTQALVSPSASLGLNILCDRGAMIQAGSVIADGVSLFGGAVVGHHTNLERGSWISSGAIVGGHCWIGERTFIGLGGTLAHGSRLGPRAFLGMGVSVSGQFGEDAAFVRKPDEPLATHASTIARVLNY
jgi:UDP-perosamine 4-acetyltransferase